MEVRWLGNSCVDMISDERVIIDPHPVIELKGKADKILITHEHDDHFRKETFEKISEGDTEIYAPKHTLEKFDIDGTAVEPGDEFEGIKVLSCQCWNSEESVGYLYEGILHNGDSAEFPDKGFVKLAFTACFPDNYDDYVEGLSKIDPDVVVPFHYDPDEKLSEAQGLAELLEKKSIKCKMLKPGEELII
ncbi:MAG: MBL fold metallo-hydrolase [Thermoplasmata archaeon]